VGGAGKGGESGQAVFTKQGGEDSKSIPGQAKAFQLGTDPGRCSSWSFLGLVSGGAAVWKNGASGKKPVAGLAV